MSKISETLAEKIRKQNKRIRDRNYRFRKMPLERQRITIAKDVLELLETEKVIAQSGTYMELDSDIEEKYWDDWSTAPEAPVQLHELIERSETCEVCGIGACFVAAVRRNDQVEASDMSGASDDDFMRSYLESWFTKDQIELIEAAFEESSRFYKGPSRKLGQRASDFGKRYDSDEERMRAIFQNIVDNGGTFVP